ncbi:hypothetical protein GBF38_000352 [Nibea albiflora]|nr:hypothetical protein GBF38_000352 [Nibea albiflora]
MDGYANGYKKVFQHSKYSSPLIVTESGQKSTGQRSTVCESEESSTGKGQAEGDTEGEQARSSQREEGDPEAEEVTTEREGEQTDKERENDEAATATHSTTGFDLRDKDTGPRQVLMDRGCCCDLLLTSTIYSITVLIATISTIA